MSKGSSDEQTRHLVFLEHWRTELAPIEGRSAQANRAGNDYALAGIKSGYLLNGGAVIAVPAFWKLLEQPSGEDQLFVIVAVAIFVIGLIFCVIGNFLAYLCLTNAGLAHVKNLESRALDVREAYYPSKDKESLIAVQRITNEQREKIFERAMKQKFWAQIIFISSITCFVLGAVIGWLSFSGFGKQFTKEAPTMFVNIVDILAWPLAGVLIILILRKPVIAITERIFRKQKIEPYVSTLEQQKSASGSSVEDQLSSPLPDPVPFVEERVKLIRAELNTEEERLKAVGVDRETALMRALARSNIQAHFEQTYNVIWGSQIEALEQINLLMNADLELIKPIYEKAVRSNPELYQNTSFDTWLRFLEVQQLVTRMLEVATVTPEGKAFLAYLIERSYTTGKVG